MNKEQRKAADEIERLRTDAERYRWLRDNMKEAPLRPLAYGAELMPDTRLRWELPTLVSWTEYSGQASLDAAIDAAMKETP